MNNQNVNKCPRCGQASLHSWHELSDEEREVVRRLPGAVDTSDADRKTMHRWCPKCWYETKTSPLDT